MGFLGFLPVARVWPPGLGSLLAVLGACRLTLPAALRARGYGVYGRPLGTFPHAAGGAVMAVKLLALLRKAFFLPAAGARP